MSPQSQDLYKALLSSERPLDAKALADKLNIFPNSVYRLIDPLIETGLVTMTDKYPHEFAAKPANEGLSLFLMSQNDWFSQQFSSAKSKAEPKEEGKIPESQQVSLSFIQSRDELMNLSAEEISCATKSVDLLRSGHEMPADVMLALVNAKNRGIPTRMLIQDYSADNADQIANWLKNGIQVRKTELKHVRLMLYDSQILYFMSYKHSDSEKDMGMKIDYPPFATILSQLFNTWWEAAESIT